MLIVGLFCSPCHLLEDSFSVVWQVRVQSFEVLSSQCQGLNFGGLRLRLVTA